MAAGDITYKYVKITIDDETGVINYAEEKYVEDTDGNKNKVGKLHRPGLVPPRVGKSFDEDGNVTQWKDNYIGDKPKVIRDLAQAMWTEDRKSAYQDQN